ncbi:MAG: translocation/assembly module TamB domain-containing protein [Armatimonadota bacterium]|nr:translocation/assembly module TamB domain-containing protein [Armatimonadota bacterium]
MAGRSTAATTAVIAFIVALAATGAAASWLVGALSLRSRAMATVALSAVLRREIEIGQVSGDAWRGILFEHIRIPSTRAGEPPLLAARRITIHLDVRAMLRDLLGRRGLAPSIAGNITEMLVDDPVLRVTRDAAGRWSVADLLPSHQRAGAASGFTGRLRVMNGVVLLVDRARLAPRGFDARFADVNGTADFASSPRLMFRASFVEERAGRRAPGRLRGAYHLDGHLLDLDLDASGVEAAPWARYILSTPGFRVTRGQVDPRLHVLRTRTDAGVRFDVSGRLAIHGGAAAFPARGAVLWAVEGEVHVADGTLTTPGVRGILNGSRVEVRGEAAFYGEPRLDLAVRSDAADLAALGRLFFPGLASRLSGVARGEVRVTGPMGAPRLEGRIAAARGRFDRLPFEQASADITLYGGLLSLTQGRGRVAGAAVSGGGLLTLGSPRFFLSLDVDGADASLVRRWAPIAVPTFDGPVRGTLTAARGGGALEVTGQVRAASARLRGIPLDELEASFRSDPTGLTIDHLRARGHSFRVSASGTISAGGALDLRALAGAADASALPVPSVATRLDGQMDFAGTIDGTVRAPQISGLVQMGRGHIAGLPVDSAWGRIVYQADRLRLEDASARSGWARYRASGTVGRQIAVDLEAERAAAGDLRRLGGFELPVGGIVTGRARVEGAATRPRVSGAVTLREAEVLGQKIDEASAEFQWDGRRLTLANARARRNRSEVHLAGSVDRLTGLALDLTAAGLDLRDVAHPVIGPTRIEGQLDARGRITGRINSPVLAVEATSANLTAGGLRFTQAMGVLRWADRTLSVEPLALRVNGEQYELRGSLTLASVPGISLTSTVTDGRLSTLLGLAGVRLTMPLDGTITGVASLEGPLANPAARLDLKLASGYLGDHPLSGRADLVLEHGSVTIQDLEFVLRRGRIAATGRYDLRGASQIEVSGSDLELDVLRPVFRFRRPLLGRLDFTVQLGGTLASPELGLDLEITRGGLEGATFDSLVAAGFYRDGVLQLVQGLLVQNGHKLRASGSVPFNPKSFRVDPQAPLDLRLTLADVDLSLLRLLTDRVDAARGPVEGALSVTGTIASPRLAGQIRARGGSVRFRGMGTDIEALDLGLHVDEGTVRVTQGTARVGGGQARLDGTMRLSLSPSNGMLLEAAPEAPLSLQAAGIRMVVPPIVDARLDGTLRLWGTLGDRRRPPTLGGHLVASEGTVAVTAPAPSGSGQGPGHGVPLAFQGLQVDAGRDLAVRVGDLRFVLKPEGALTLSGTPQAPRLEGTVEAQRGTVVALGNAFDLQEGEATFRPVLGIRPQVLARAATRVGSTAIMLTVRGVAPDALTLDLESDPPLPRSEIVGLLGRQAGISQLLTGDVTGLLRAEISRRLFAPATMALGRALGLSELTIEYEFDRPLRLTIGKALLPNLYLTAFKIFDDTPNWLWAMEYRFARGWQAALRLGPEGQRAAVVWYTTRF